VSEGEQLEGLTSGVRFLHRRDVSYGSRVDFVLAGTHRDQRVNHRPLLQGRRAVTTGFPFWPKRVTSLRTLRKTYGEENP
jgi:hypothetical protein